ncbi:Mu transposase C-terminal domain-containing protein [Pseudomonas bohemica]|uniref:Mu transposase C-terminal domain-containing protein n=1 Tax=Pseudomonas bohemica TaxID=2044872 RepID=UPI000DA62AA8|nr:Mu transposase C-terminal domain-containing protein [Pseudomonas bohemica]
MRISVLKGSMFQVGEDQVRVVEYLEDSYVRVTNLTTNRVESVSVGELRPVLSEELLSSGCKIAKWVGGEIDDRVKENAKERYDLVSTLYAKGLENSAVVEELKEQLGVSQRTAYRILAKYNDTTGPVSLLEEKRGRVEGTRFLSKDVEDVIKEQVDVALVEAAAGTKFTYAKTYERVKEQCSFLKIPRPSLGTIKARTREYATTKQKMTIANGAKRARDESRPKPGSLDTKSPLEWIQIDHSPVDVILVDELNRQPIGRPWVTFAIDIFTRVILGVYLSWSHPSRYSVACCIANMACPKDKWLKSIGCEFIKYPFYGEGKTLHSDNAAEFKCDELTAACDAHYMEMKFRREKHYGGHIERWIGTFMGEVHYLNGTTLSNIEEKGDYDSESKSCYTFDEFRKWMLAEIERYHIRPHKGLNNFSPKMVWNNYFKLDTGGPYCPPVPADEKVYKLDFMPRTKVTVHPWGVALQYVRYWDEILRNQIGERLTLVYNPETLRTVWLEIDGKYYDINYSNVMNSDTSMEELKFAQHLAKINGIDPRDEDRVFELMRFQKNLEDTAKSDTKQARKNRSKRGMRKEHHFEPMEIQPVADSSSSDTQRPTKLKKVFFYD